jgi:hypothetical protein
MKKFIILFFVAFAYVSKAQTYFPLVENNKMWNYKTNYYNPYLFTSHSVKLEGDTIINSKNHKKVWYCNDEYYFDWHQSGFIREDIKTKKVYVFQGLEEELLYDFSLQLNDTFKTSYDCIQTVFKIDSIKINDKFRKRLWLSIWGNQDTTTYWGYELWIEGIGSNKGFPTVCPSALVGSWDELLCFHEYYKIVYENPIYNSCYMNNTGTTEIEKPEIEIFYADKFLNINFDEKAEYKLVIYDILGNTIFSKQIQSSEKINLEKFNLKQGIYIYTLLNKEKILKKNKIIF